MGFRAPLREVHYAFVHQVRNLNAGFAPLIFNQFIMLGSTQDVLRSRDKGQSGVVSLCPLAYTPSSMGPH